MVDHQADGALRPQNQQDFGTRDELLLGALRILNADAERRARERLSLDDTPTVRQIVRGVLLELLPLDEERRNRHLVYVAYFVRFLADPHLAAAVREAPPALEDLVAGLLGHGRDLGEVQPHIDTAAEAAFLVAGAQGLQASALLSQHTNDQAVALIDHQLDRIFTTIAS